MLHYKINITIVIPGNVDIMMFYCWANVANSDTAFSQHKDKPVCLLGLSFDKQIYKMIYLQVQKLSLDFLSLKFKV